MKAQTRCRGITLLSCNHGAKCGWVVNATPRPLCLRERDPIPTAQEARRAPRPVWTGANDLAFIGNRSLDRPARSESLYRLTYPVP